MTQRIPSLASGVMFILVFCLVAPALGQDDIENPDRFPGVWYRLLLDGNGDYIEGQGDGLGWYHYPQSDTWRMWFYNGPYNPARKGFLDYHVYTKAVDPAIGPTHLVAHFGWTTAAWSSLNKGRPPLPDDMPTAGQESLYMSSSLIYTVNSVVKGSVETERTYSIDDYNPEWVCITLAGSNAYVYRGAFHECTGSADFGDAPDNAYLTLLASNGASHTVVPGVFLGTAIDSESDGQPTATATGDDAAGRADEDGVSFTSAIRAGRAATIEVTASTFGYLNAWIDFDGNGRFDDRNDRIFTDRFVKGGINELAFSVPANAVAGWTYARFRFDTRGLLESYGPAEDGEVEDYRVQIVTLQNSLAISGATRLVWSQPPSAAISGDANAFTAASVSSSLHLHELAADDWEPVDDQPVTGIHWWGVFDGWTESYLPPEPPLAFHIGIWTDGTLDSDTFDHPGELVWEMYSTNWVWAASGREEADNKGQSGRTCFLFSQQLSQDQWFQIDQAKDGSASRVCWLSIAALYDSTDREPQHVWTWKLRATASGATGASVRTVVPVSADSYWPPTLGAQWETGSALSDSRFNPLDMAFQLTTYEPLELNSHASAGLGVGFSDLASLAADWLNTVR